MREQRLVAVDRLQHQEVGELGGAAAAGRRDATGERLAALVQQPEQLARERRQPAGGAHVQHRRDEALVEHDLPVRTALDDVRERDDGIRVRNILREQQPRAQRADFEHRRIAAVRRCVARLLLAHVVSHQVVAAGVAVRFHFTRAAQRRWRDTGSDRARRRRCRAAPAADRRRASGMACRRERRRRARRSADLPMLSRSRSNSISVKPQPCGTSGRHRVST